MKQHITPEQAKEITEEQFYSLFDEIVKRKDWANYHHKKVTIGKCIEVLTSKGINDGVTGWMDEYTIDIEWNGELIDSLWESVKLVLRA